MNYPELDSLCEKIRSFEEKIPIEEKSGWHGIINYLLTSNNPLFWEELLPVLKKFCGKTDFRTFFMDIRKSRLEREKKKYLVRLEQSPSDWISCAHIECASQELAITDFGSLMEKYNYDISEGCMREIFQNLCRAVSGTQGGFEKIERAYPFYCVASDFYEHYLCGLKEKKEFENNLDFLTSYFDRLGIDIKNMPSFSKCDLLEYSKKDFTIFNDKDSRTLKFNSDPKKHYLWLDMGKPVLAELQRLHDMGLIGKLAFRITGITEFVPCMEEMERGRVFSLNLPQLPSFTQFYDKKNYGDKLQVKFDRDSLELTFEELTDDFEVVDEYVRTQVIHMRFVQANDGFFIEHLDHEYIYYKLEEYEKRETDPTVKGEKKVKTFKINDAAIPLAHKVGDMFFLYFILDNYFTQKALLKEYFSEVIKQN